jgi:Protein of unknown function (DUF3499)
MAYCSKPNCRAPTAVVLAYNYADRFVLLEDAPERGMPPQTYALCLSCADGLQAPRGWELQDLRSRPRLYATLSE